MLVSMKDIGVVAEEEIRHHGNDPFAVGAIDQHDAGFIRGRGCHGGAMLSEAVTR